MAVSRYEEILKQVRAQAEAQKQADKAASDAQYAAQIKNAQEKYGEQIEKTEHAYDDQLSQANVQRIINERQIRENMANMGLTDSGLNRTQQTAAQLSQANAAHKISVAKQQAVDTLAQALAQQVTSLQNAQTAASAGIDSAYEKNAQSNATSMYNQEVKSAADVEKQYVKSQQAVAEEQMKQQAAQAKEANTAMTALYKVMDSDASDNSKRMQAQAYFNRYGGSMEFYQMCDEYGLVPQADGTVVYDSVEKATGGTQAGTAQTANTAVGKTRVYTTTGGETLKDIADASGADYATIVRLNKAWIHQKIPAGKQILLAVGSNQTK